MPAQPSIKMKDKTPGTFNLCFFYAIAQRLRDAGERNKLVDDKERAIVNHYLKFWGLKETEEETEEKLTTESLLAGAEQNPHEQPLKLLAMAWALRDFYVSHDEWKAAASAAASAAADDTANTAFPTMNSREEFTVFGQQILGKNISVQQHASEESAEEKFQEFGVYAAQVEPGSSSAHEFTGNDHWTIYLNSNATHFSSTKDEAMGSADNAELYKAMLETVSGKSEDQQADSFRAVMGEAEKPSVADTKDEDSQALDQALQTSVSASSWDSFRRSPTDRLPADFKAHMRGTYSEIRTAVAEVTEKVQKQEPGEPGDETLSQYAISTLGLAERPVADEATEEATKKVTKKVTETATEEANKERGTYELMQVDWEDGNSKTIDADTQAKKILDNVRQVYNGLKRKERTTFKIGVTYSANLGQCIDCDNAYTKRKWTQPNIGTGSANQGAVVEKILELLQAGKDYEDLHECFQIVPIPTMGGTPQPVAGGEAMQSIDSPFNKNVFENYLNKVSAFAALPNHHLLVWTNQDSSDKPAIGGGVAQRSDLLGDNWGAVRDNILEKIKIAANEKCRTSKALLQQHISLLIESILMGSPESTALDFKDNPSTPDDLAKEIVSNMPEKSLTSSDGHFLLKSDDLIDALKNKPAYKNISEDLKNLAFHIPENVSEENPIKLALDKTSSITVSQLQALISLSAKMAIQNIDSKLSPGDQLKIRRKIDAFLREGFSEKPNEAGSVEDKKLDTIAMRCLLGVRLKFENMPDCHFYELLPQACGFLNGKDSYASSNKFFNSDLSECFHEFQTVHKIGAQSRSAPSVFNSDTAAAAVDAAVDNGNACTP